MQAMDIGLVGLGVMGENLALNLERNGFSVSGFDLDAARRENFAVRTQGLRAQAASSLPELVASLTVPRRIWMMVPAGAAVDQVLAQLRPLLSAGDVLIDGGNTLYTDTQRRIAALQDSGILYVGAGVSGGEEGALLGPALMPGGSPEAWPLIQPLMQAIAARAEDGQPCCQWMGPGGAGHFVKMVHNGIEYADMQLIAEAYDLLKHVAGLTNEQIGATFTEWNNGDLDSFLIDITCKIFNTFDEDGGYLVDKVLDKAAQKGTGKWTSQLALDLGVPTTAITEAVFARCLSFQKDERVAASTQLPGPVSTVDAGDVAQLVNDIRDALYASKIVAYAQGFVQLDAAAAENGWTLDRGSIATIWRGGCIIRARFLNRIKGVGIKLALGDQPRQIVGQLAGRFLEAAEHPFAPAGFLTHAASFPLSRPFSCPSIVAVTRLPSGCD